MDWSHGSAYPYQVRPNALIRDHTFTEIRVSACASRGARIVPTPHGRVAEPVYAPNSDLAEVSAARRRPQSLPADAPSSAVSARQSARRSGGRRHGPGRGGPPSRLGPVSMSATGGGSAARVARAQRSARRREWVVRAGETPAPTPMWTTRTAWVDGLRTWATAAVVRAVCARLGCSIATATLLAIAAAMAEYADHATGRHMAATRATIAARVGCDSRTVTTAWRVLRETGWAVEAARGTSTPAGRRTSVWHLTPRRPVGFFHLPPSRSERRSSPVGKDSPSARECVRATDSSDQQPRPRRRKRRPASADTISPDARRLGAYLAGHAHGLFHSLDRPDRTHSGSLALALERSGLALATWSGRQLIAAIDADMRATGWSWPDQIKRPGAFLASRLRRLPARPDRSAPVYGGLEQSRTGPVEPSKARPVLVAAVAEFTAPEPVQTAAGRAYARRLFAEQRQQRLANAQTSQAVVVAVRQSAPPAAAETAECAMCGCADAPRRRFLPARRSHICDACFQGGGGEQARTGRAGTVGSRSAVPTCQ